MFIKVCQITNIDDALLAAELGVDAVGFIFAESPRQVDVDTVAAICRRTPPDLLTVGVFRHHEPEVVIDAVQRSGVRAAQLHGRETPDDADAVRPHVEFLIKAFAAGDPDVAESGGYDADAVLLDNEVPGSGRRFDWSLVENLPSEQRLLLSGGLTPSNVGEAISVTRPWGVDVGTSLEARPGVKDPELVRRFVRAVRDGSCASHGPRTDRAEASG